MEIWISRGGEGGWGGGVICNFEFGLREKFGNLDFPQGGGNLQLRIWT